MVFDYLDPQTFPTDAPSDLYVEEGIVCLLDFDDYIWALQWRWSYQYDKRGRKIYIVRNTRISNRQVKLYLHKEIMLRKEPNPPTPRHTIADHLDSNSLDNRRHNLRWATPKMNAQNKHGAAARQGLLFVERAA